MPIPEILLGGRVPRLGSAQPYIQGAQVGDSMRRTDLAESDQFGRGLGAFGRAGPKAVLVELLDSRWVDLLQIIPAEVRHKVNTNLNLVAGNGSRP